MIASVLKLSIHGFSRNIFLVRLVVMVNFCQSTTANCKVFCTHAPKEYIHCISSVSYKSTFPVHVETLSLFSCAFKSTKLLARHTTWLLIISPSTTPLPPSRLIIPVPYGSSEPPTHYCAHLPEWLREVSTQENTVGPIGSVQLHAKNDNKGL